MADLGGFDEALIAGLPEAARNRIYRAIRAEEDSNRIQTAMRKLGEIPAARDAMQKLIADHLPEMAGPEAMARKFTNEALDGMRADLAKEREERAAEKATREADDAKRDMERRWLAGRATLRDDGYTQEGIDAVEQLMEKRGIADHEAARALHEKLNPPPEPVVTGGTRWNFFDRAEELAGKEAYDALMSGNDEKFLAYAIPAALKEVRNG